jgi:hypothetical protein
MASLYLTRHLFSLAGRACQWISFLLTLRWRLRDADLAASIEATRSGSTADLRAADAARSVEEKPSGNGNAGCPVVKEELRLAQSETGDSRYPLSLKVTPS